MTKVKFNPSANLAVHLKGQVFGHAIGKHLYAQTWTVKSATGEIIRIRRPTFLFVGIAEAPSKALQLFFLFSGWVKSNHL